MDDLIRQLIERAADPLANMREQAKQITRHHIVEGYPTPIAGSKIRCVFSASRKAFNHDPFILVEGRVYDVVVVGGDAVLRRESTLPEEDRQTEEKLKAIVEDMLRTAEKHPNAPGATCWIRDTETGEEMAITFPNYPTAVFMITDDEAVSEPQIKDLVPGTFISFTELSTVGMHGVEVKIGKPYQIERAQPCCSCANPECPGKDQIVYVIRDETGEELEVSVPFSPYGILKPSND